MLNHVRGDFLAKVSTPVGRMSLAAMASAVVGAVITPTLAWTTDAEDVGRYNLLMVYLGLVVVASSLGLDQAYIRFFHAASDRRRLLASAIGLPLAVAGLLSVSILLAPVWTARNAFDLSTASVGIGLAATVVLSVLYRFAAVEIRMAESAAALALNQLLPKVVLLAAVLFAVGSGSRASFGWIIWMYAVGLALAILAWALRKRSASVRGSSDTGRRVNTRELLRYGSPLTVSALAFWVAASTGAVGLRMLTSVEEVALYALALSFALPASLLQVVLASAWAPIVFRWSDEEARQQLPVAQAAVSLGAVWLFLLLGSLSWSARSLVPATYADVTYMIPAAMAPAIWYAVSEVTAVGVQIRRRTNLLALASIVAACVGLIAIVPLVEKWGARGALVAMMAAHAALLIIRTEASARVWMSVPRRRLYLEAAAIGALATTTLLVGPDLGAAVYLAWGAAVALFAAITFRAIRRPS